MIIDSDASESEMVLEFLRAEVGSLIGQGAPAPDLSDAHDNSKRAFILDCLRGYSRRIWLFSKFPTDTVWKRVKLTREDFPNLRYVRSSPWRQLAGDDLSVVTGAKRIMEGTFDRTYAEIARRVPKIEAVARAIRDGADLPPVILITAGSDHVVVEGNRRVTGFVMAQSDRPMLALCGSSPSMLEWSQQAWS
jgi:hypothetical protein